MTLLFQALFGGHNTALNGRRSTTTIAVFSPESGFPYSAKAERGEGGGLTLLCTNSTSSQEKEPITTAQKKSGGRKEVQKAIWEKIGPPTPTQASEHSSFPQFLSAQEEGKMPNDRSPEGEIKNFFLSSDSPRKS